MLILNNWALASGWGTPEIEVKGSRGNQIHWSRRERKNPVLLVKNRDIFVVFQVI